MDRFETRSTTPPGYDFIGRVSMASIPGYMMLNDFEWVDDFLKIKQIKEEIVRLRTQKREIKKITPTKSDLLESARREYDEFKEARINFLKTFLLRRVRTGHGQGAGKGLFSHLKYHHDSHGWIPFVGFDEIEEAIDSLPDGEMKPLAEIKSEFEDLIQRIEKLRAEIVELSPTIYFHLQGGQVTSDIREQFVIHWIRLQGKVCSPCGPRGIVLDLSDPKEQEAWARLGLRDFVNPDERGYHPNPGHNE